jgi:predicted membrane-bound mannosyltransferase
MDFYKYAFCFFCELFSLSLFGAVAVFLRLFYTLTPLSHSLTRALPCSPLIVDDVVVGRHHMNPNKQASQVNDEERLLKFLILSLSLLHSKLLFEV